MTSSIPREDWILDTNVLVLTNRFDSEHANLISIISKRKNQQIIVTKAILREYHQVLTSFYLQAFWQQLEDSRSIKDVVPEQLSQSNKEKLLNPKRGNLRDPKDVMFIEAARSRACISKRIVTTDRGHLLNSKTKKYLAASFNIHTYKIVEALTILS